MKGCMDGRMHGWKDGWGDFYLPARSSSSKLLEKKPSLFPSADTKFQSSLTENSNCISEVFLKRGMQRLMGFYSGI